MDMLRLLFMSPLLVALALVEHCRSEPPPPARVQQPPEHFAVRGIDVSHHQGRIDWSEVAASGQVDFVWLKATEGTTHTDRRFALNLAQARAAGLRVGAYHFWSMCRSGSAQAQHFIETVPRFEGSLPPAVDVERDARCNRHPTPVLAHQVEVFRDALRAHYGQEPLLYTSQGWLEDGYLPGDVPLWLPAYTRPPRLGWLFWQYSATGTVPGVEGPVDLDVFAGTPEELDGLSGGAGR